MFLEFDNEKDLLLLPMEAGKRANWEGMVDPGRDSEAVWEGWVGVVRSSFLSDKMGGIYIYIIWREKNASRRRVKMEVFVCLFF